MRLSLMLAAGLVATCGRADETVPPGSEGGPCYGNGTCDAGLNCSMSDLCVRSNGTCEGAGCDPEGHPDMVLIDDFPGRPFFIDIYEASVWAGGDWGYRDQDWDADGRIPFADVVAAHAESHGFELDDNGGEENTRPTTKVARSVAGEYPAVGVSFYQAMGACTQAGKRLCTRAEWVWACRSGTAFNVFPYGSTFDGGDDPGEDCWTTNLSSQVQVTGSAASCRTPNGIYDLSGNAWEWTHYQDQGEAGLSGGAFGSSHNNADCERLTVFPPSAPHTDGSFRCCVAR